MLNSLIIYAISSLVVTVIPGPTMLLALSNGTSRKTEVIIMGVLGAACSDLILISAVALGLGAVMVASESLFSVVKWMGVIYLLWLTVSLLRAKVSSQVCVESNTLLPHAISGTSAFIRSLLAALSNPKGLLFFSAFLPQFLDITQPSIPQYLSFALLTVTIDVIIMTIYAIAGYCAALYLSVSCLKWMNRISAATLACMATGLALYRRQV